MTLHAPQMIMLALMIFGVARGIIKHGESDGEVNAATSLVGAGITGGLLWWGGFFG